MGVWTRRQPDVPVDARVVEEVVPVAQVASGRGLLDPAGRDGVEGQFVVGHDGEGGAAAGETREVMSTSNGR